MKFATKVTAIAATGVLVALGLTSGVASAATSLAEDCKTVTSHLTNHPDSGNHGTWALDDFTRTVKVCHVPEVIETAPSVSKALVVVQSWNYHVTVTDEGTFTTVAGAHNSPNNGFALIGNVPGTMKGGFTADVKAPHDWGYFTPEVLDGKNFTGAPGTEAGGPKTSNWVKALWSDGLDEKSSFINDDWAWTYKTCNQQWIDSVETDDGTSHAAGDITGYSRLACPRVVFENVCGQYVNVIVFNDAPWAKAVLKFKLSTDEIVRELVGQEEWTITLHTTDLVKVLDTHGHTLGEHTWAEPQEGCSTPSPTPSATPSTSASAVPTTAPVTETTDPGTGPVTGASLTGAYFGGGAALAVAVVLVGLYIARRRRASEEPVSE